MSKEGTSGATFVLLLAPDQDVVVPAGVYDSLIVQMKTVIRNHFVIVWFLALSALHNNEIVVYDLHLCTLLLRSI